MLIIITPLHLLPNRTPTAPATGSALLFPSNCGRNVGLSAWWSFSMRQVSVSCVCACIDLCVTACADAYNGLCVCERICLMWVYM